MAKKYLSLAEAAEMLQLDPEALKEMRAAGEIRGFADRGNWKFRSEDVENLVRSRQADSDPDVPILGASDSSPALSGPDDSNFAGGVADDTLASVLSDEDPGDDPTIIRRKDEDLSQSDSDVRLIVDDSISMADSDPELSIVDGSDSDVLLSAHSDSDVQLSSASGSLSGTGLLSGAGDIGDADALDGGSDSDVQLLAASDVEIPVQAVDSDSDVRLTDDDVTLTMPGDSDSDVQLVDLAPSGNGSSAGAQTDADVKISDEGSDSDVVLPTEMDIAVDEGSKSDVVLPAGDDDGITLDFDDDSNDAGASVLLGGDMDDSGITLEGGSGLLVTEDSGISLEGPSDSGISLDMDDEGITLAEDSGSGLSAVGDSGISLEGDSGIALAADNGGATAAEFDAFDDDDVPETQFEIPSSGAEADSEFDLDMDDGETGGFAIEDDDATADFDLGDDLDDDTGEFDLDDSDMSDVSDFDSLDAASVADIDLIEGDDAFDDESFESEAGGGYGAVGLVRPASAVQQEWGTGPVVLSICSMIVMLLAMFVSFDLLSNIYSWNSAEPASGVIVDSLSGMFG